MSQNERSMNRLKSSKHKPKIYCRVGGMIDLSNRIIDIQDQNRENQFGEILAYLNSTSYSELKQFGSLFSYSNYFDFILTNNDENENFLAFMILAIVTDSESANLDFYMDPRLFQFCESNIFDEKYTKYVLKILISGSLKQKFASFLLRMNICDILIRLPVTDQVSQFASYLTYFTNIDYLPNLMNLCENILNNRNKTTITICYLFKAFHHFYSWEDVENSIIQSINEKFSAYLNPLAPTLLESSNYRFINALFRYLIHFDNIDIFFAFSILQIFSNITIQMIDENVKKNVKLGLILFIQNSEEWKNISDINDQLLSFIFNKSDFFNAGLKPIFFNAILNYYSIKDEVIDKFMKNVVEWCLLFVSDSDYSVAALKEIILIKNAAKSDFEINLTIKSGVQKYEESLAINENDDNIVALAAELLEFCQEE